MPFFINSLLKLRRNILSTLDTWGRDVDRSPYYGNTLKTQPHENPDPIDRDSQGKRYFKIVNNPYVKAGLNFRDVSRLFVSAAGLEPDDNGAYFPPQLIYTTPGKKTALKELSKQYDELFDGGFSSILRSLQMPAMEYGRAIGEIEWYRENGKILSSFIWSRDPEKYLINPPNYAPGLYQKNHTYSTALSGDITLMPPGKFMVITFDPLYNNPYGQSVLRPIADMTETWVDMFDAWRMALIKAGYGAWLGTYGNDIAGDDEHSKAAREQFLTAVKTIANGTASIFHENRNIRAEKLQFEAQAFLDFHTAYVQAVSVLLTGSATALIEGKYGSYSKEESTGARQKSDKEQSDALLMGLAFTYQFNRFWMFYNYGPSATIPQLQLIRPELIMPTTPEGQETQIDIEDSEREEIEIAEQEDEPAEMQEEEEDPLAREFDTFPDPTPEPAIFKDVEESAREYLRNLPVKNYNDVTPNEASNVFTVKRLRNFEDAQQIQEVLKEAILDTIGIDSEAQAWTEYITAARSIFQRLGLEISSSLQSDLIVSFRQSRQSAYNYGIEQLIDSNPDGLTGIMTMTMEDDRVRTVHALWNGIVLAPDDPRRERIKKPMDFGCRCYDVPVYNNESPVTPENEIPEIYPGETYRGYALNA